MAENIEASTLYPKYFSYTYSFHIQDTPGKGRYQNSHVTDEK